MAMLFFWLSLAIVIASATVIAWNDDIPGGFVGTTALGGVAVFGIAGFGCSDPPAWLVGFMVCLAWVCLWALIRWRVVEPRRTARKQG